VPFLQDDIAQGDVVRFDTDAEAVRWSWERVSASGHCTIRVLSVPAGPLRCIAAARWDARTADGETPDSTCRGSLSPPTPPYRPSARECEQQYVSNPENRRNIAAADSPNYLATQCTPRISLAVTLDIFPRVVGSDTFPAGQRPTFSADRQRLALTVPRSASRAGSG
jgi:hypothetical protein